MIFTLSIEKTNRSAHPTIFCFCFPDDSLIIEIWVLINTRIC